MGIKEIYDLYKLHYKVVKDTREDVTNAMYFSLKGASFNGNQYALQALKNGASYAIIDEEVYKTDERLILVEDALTCLQDLARYHRQQLSFPIFALTGSNGKTTTKELINAVLNKKYRCHSTKGNLNNHIGVPLTLLSMNPSHNFGVVEMGANHQKEIEQLCSIALPDFGYITNFGRVHLEGFGSFEGVIKGKTEMYRHLEMHKKQVFVNQKDAIQMEKSEGMDRILFGGSDDDCELKFLNADPFVSIGFEEVEIDSKLIGDYNYPNIAVAACIGKHFGVPVVSIKEAIEEYTPKNNRSQIIVKGSNRIILDAYNANPNSMEVAVQNLSNLSALKKALFLGDMFELGDDTALEHQKLVDLIMQLDFDHVFLIGANFSQTTAHSEKLKVFENFETFKAQFKDVTLENVTILIKASRGMALERVLDYI